MANLCVNRKMEKERSRTLNLFYCMKIFSVGDWNGIQVFTKEGKCIQLFGSYGKGKGEFRRVSGVCIGNDKLYIVDQGNFRIQVWN